MIIGKLMVTGTAVLCLVFAPDAKAACNSLRGSVLGSRGLSAALHYTPPLLQAQTAIAGGQEEGEQNERSKKSSSAIVGMWITDFYTGTSTVPSDHTIEQFFSDGNELISSSGFPPASDNKCFGIWQPSGPRTITLTHIGWDFDVASGNFKGTVRFVATLTLAHDGNSFEGKVVQDEIDSSGNVIFGPVEGVMKGRRFKVATSLDAIDPR
jgi:hypothetical protein